jgi:ribose-phosphate pyrophosphokinase
MDGWMRLISGDAPAGLGAAVAQELGVTAVERTIERFPDGELHVQLHEELRDDDAYIVQSTGPPSHENLTELLLLADAAYRTGAARITAIVPYLAYARQDRRTAPGQPVGLRVVADLLRASHVDRLVVVDPHTQALESIVSVPVETISAIPLLCDALQEQPTDDAVLVAPDLGAAKLVHRYASILGLDVAIVRKTRVSGDEVRSHEIIGAVSGRRPIVVDDMIATGGTVVAAIEAVRDSGADGPATVVTSHGLLVGGAVRALRDLEVAGVHLTDSVTVDAPGLALHVSGLAPRLAEVVRRLSDGRSLGELAAYR